MSNQINPTITLAELYESQNQLMDALDIYQKLQRISPSEIIREKLNDISRILLEHNNEHYNKLTRLIFTKEEIEYFKIISTFKTNILNSTEEKSDMYDIENLDDLEFCEGNSVEKFFGANENDGSSETDDKNLESAINTNIEKSSQKSDESSSQEDNTIPDEKDQNYNTIKDYQIEQDVEEILHLNNDEETTSTESQDLTSEQDISKSDLVEELSKESFPENEKVIDKKTEDNVDGLNSTMQEIMKIKQKLLKEKELLLQKASEIDRDRKLNGINLDKIKTKIARLENLDEEKRN